LSKAWRVPFRGILHTVTSPKKKEIKNKKATGRRFSRRKTIKKKMDIKRIKDNGH
jgi:hypothetical protein